MKPQTVVLSILPVNSFGEKGKRKVIKDQEYITKNVQTASGLQNLVEAVTDSLTYGTTLTTWETISSNLNMSKTVLFTMAEALLTDCPENHVYLHGVWPMENAQYMV